MATSSSAETVRVIVRCRPMNQREIDLKCQSVVKMDIPTRQVFLENIEQTSEPPKQFTFDAVYPEDSITETLYADSVFPLVESVLEGYNATVFAYGQTGCGKSFTMQGISTPGSPQRGVIPRSFEHIFEASSVATETKYLIRASYLEIYNETIRDLLGKDVKATLDLKEYADKGVIVQNLTWHQCTSVTDCERLMDRGNKNRATGATLMNKDSSRSHSIFTIVTEMCSRSEIDGQEHIRAGKLNLVDLAGSERQSKTQAEGERLREATRINLSLSALGNVISALVDGRAKHIPYRDSKLTRLLQDSLGGNTKTLMVAAISPAHDNYDETLSTLRYANRAKNIKNKPRINEDPRDAQMKLLQEEINRLKQELMNAGQGVRPITNGATFDDDEIEKEKERLKEEFERQAEELRRQCEAERLTKEDLQRKYDQLQNQYEDSVQALGSGNRTTQSKRKKKGTNEDRKENLPNDPEEKRRRLEELQKNFVGGEEANNEERKKKRKKKLNEMKEQQEKRKQMTVFIDTNDEDMMMRVFDNAQEEIHFLTQKLEQERVEKKRLQNDNEDLQAEFERDRQGYLNTIRAQEKQLLLFRTLLEKMSGLMQRNCNYSNIEKMIEQSRYDEEKNEYHVPEPFIEEVQFPQVNQSSSSNRVANQSFYPTPRTPAPITTDYQLERSYPVPMTPINGYQNTVSSMTEEELRQRYAREPEIPLGQTRCRRQEHLLHESLQTQKKFSPLKTNNGENDYMNRRLNPYDPSTRLAQRYGFSSEKP